MLITAKMAMRKREELQCLQNKFDFMETPARHLRAVHVTQSNMAREVDFAIFRNMRVPESSVIHRVYSDGLAYLEAKENLDIWESSDGRVLEPCLVNVKARKSWEGVEALVTPLSNTLPKKDGHQSLRSGKPH
jgi:hypothetical protein